MGKILLVFILVAILMEDGSSIKKTAEEKKEDEEIAKAVNATLAAEEEKKRRDDEDEKKKKIRTQDEKKRDVDVKGKGKDEACPPLNFTCPTVEPCEDCPKCPSVRCDPCPEKKNCVPCPGERPCPEIDCHPCKECPPCKKCGLCPVVRPCQPCGPCPGENSTRRDQELTPPSCPEPSVMTVPVATAVGAAATLLAAGVAAVLGLLLRYVPPLVSGFTIIALFVFVWYLCSHYPDTAREIGGRVVEVLREATSTLSHRILAAIRHHDQVGVPTLVSS
jgi:hypothetical protein